MNRMKHYFVGIFFLSLAIMCIFIFESIEWEYGYYNIPTLILSILGLFIIILTFTLNHFEELKRLDDEMDSLCYEDSGKLSGKELYDRSLKKSGKKERPIKISIYKETSQSVDSGKLGGKDER